MIKHEPVYYCDLCGKQVDYLAVIKTALPSKYYDCDGKYTSFCNGFVDLCHECRNEITRFFEERYTIKTTYTNGTSVTRKTKKE